MIMDLQRGSVFLPLLIFFYIIRWYRIKIVYYIWVYHVISRHGTLNEQLRSPKKLYAADRGIRVLSAGYRDTGSLFENYVYLNIAHREPRFIIRDGIEIDFYTSDRTLFEVIYD